MSEAQKKPKSSWVNLAVDYGPLLVFFLAYRYFKRDAGDAGLAEVVAVTKGTAAFMAATVVALIVSKLRLGRISPMLWLSTVLILGFGTLTVLLGDPFWIQVKPTAIYLLFSGVLFAGLARGKAMLRYLLEAAFDGLNEEGWLKLSRNWAFFFLFLAGLNEVLRYFFNAANGNFEIWLQAKLWGVTTLSFLFTFAQIPMLMKHGLAAEAETEVEQNPPHD
ncbi:Intracellular septation protein A [Novosphingobium aromaticivorans DSM 12444]|uniref:Inner membrane-spanning protein YciB n=1 Tax=Novosphingobium aromaticivorans (strain ATCC 700278 / DSM 12444 / CCUG 56034 / CIP 105152 / NBRC 16084 / F199) TaxID=279238 RepID=Q2G8I0_NOVAD|nr:inner membrane-spanning protein YciB [Novosphingobium aromaticivorans]ABD25843.1 Intracellular septation protein A [Novosphingobium aromaticivorans DSM 12444]SCY05446.1 intracellular septation protein [Novosphingobium aromaticivorans]